MMRLFTVVAIFLGLLSTPCMARGAEQDWEMGGTLQESFCNLDFLVSRASYMSWKQGSPLQGSLTQVDQGMQRLSMHYPALERKLYAYALLRGKLAGSAEQWYESNPDDQVWMEKNLDDEKIGPKFWDYYRKHCEERDYIKQIELMLGGPN